MLKLFLIIIEIIVFTVNHFLVFDMIQDNATVINKKILKIYIIFLIILFSFIIWYTLICNNL